MSSRERIQRIKQKLDKGIHGADQRSKYKALLGYGDGITLFVDGRGREWVWARVQGHGAPQRALCTKVTPLYGMPVKLQIDSDDRWEVSEIDSAQGSAFMEGRGIPAVPQHNATHGKFGSDPLRLDSSQFSPLLTRPTEPTTSLSVYLEPLVYLDADGELQEWAGGVVDLSSYVPVGANVQRVVIVGLDKATNTSTVLAGTPTVKLQGNTLYVPFTIEEIAAIAIDDAIEPSFAVRLYRDQATIEQYDIFKDLRRWFTSNGELTGGGVLAVQTQDKVIQNTTTETSALGTLAGSATLAADYLEEGTVLRLSGGGFYNATGTPNLTFKVKLGGTTILDSGGISLSAATTGGWWFEILITCRAVGVSGSVVAVGTLQYGTNHETLRTSGPVTIDTTGTLLVDVTAQWGTADTGNALDTTSFVLWEPTGGGGGGSGLGVSDHGALTGLSDDDHSQYHNDARGDTRYQGQIDDAIFLAW